MKALALALLVACAPTWAATQYICATAGGSGDGSSLVNCKAAGANFASITVGTGDTLRICEKIRGTLSWTSTNNVTVDLDCNNEADGEISGADIVTAFAAADANGEYATTGTFTVPTWVLVDGEAWREGVKGSLASDEWAFNSSSGGTAAVYLGSNPSGRTVEIATRGIAIEAITSTGVAVSGGSISAVRHTGSANGNAGVLFRESFGTVSRTAFHAVRKPTDVLGDGAMIVTDIDVYRCGDGPDANQGAFASRPTLTANRNTIADCQYDDWWTNSAISHAFTMDGEGIACTDCAAIFARDNHLSRVYHALSTRADSASIQRLERNFIENTQDEGISLGCTNSSGVLDVVVSTTLMTGIGRGGGFDVGSYAISTNIESCGNGSDITLAHNDIAESAQGFYFDAAAAQTGTIRVLDNAVLNVDPTGVTGTHYFVNWAPVDVAHSLTIVENYNDFHQTYGVGFFRWVGSNARAFSAFATYKADSSQDANSIVTLPNFAGGLIPTNAAGFRPLSSSPLCSAGVHTSAVKNDYYGKRFELRRPIGAMNCRGDDFGTRTPFGTRAARTFN